MNRELVDIVERWVVSSLQERVFQDRAEAIAAFQAWLRTHHAITDLPVDGQSQPAENPDDDQSFQYEIMRNQDA